MNQVYPGKRLVIKSINDVLSYEIWQIKEFLCRGENHLKYLQCVS
jgi:hypothetical protein